MKRLSVIFLSILLLSCSNNEKEAQQPFSDNFEPSNYAVENSYTEISFDESWQFADFSKINSGSARLYNADNPRKNITVAVNAGHGTEGAKGIKVFSHPDKSPKITGGTNEEGAVESLAISSGMTFECGLTEAEANLRVAIILRRLLLQKGYDVLMIRNGADVQLDNIARTVISNNNADIHIAIHFDSDTRTMDKGCFYCGIPAALKALPNVALHYSESERLGSCLINQLKNSGAPVFSNGRLEIDLMQTSYSTIPTADIELGNQCTIPNTGLLEERAQALFKGIEEYFS